MPEEINRVFTDRISTLLLCPTETAVNNLKHEGSPFAATSVNKAKHKQRIENIGDVMHNAVFTSANALNYKSAWKASKSKKKLTRSAPSTGKKTPITPHA